MANIDLKGVYSEKRSQFRTDGAGSRRFERAFIDSANASIGFINRHANLETRISIVDNTEAVIDLDTTNIDALSDLITIELIKRGQRPAQGEENTFSDLNRQRKEIVSSIAWDIQNRAQDADTDDETSYAQLGALG